MQSINPNKPSAAETQAAIRQKLADASAQFSKDLVVELNEYYELETRTRRIYVMKRQSIVDAATSGQLKEHGLDEQTKQLRLLTEFVKDQQNARSHLALEMVRASARFAVGTEVV